MRLCDKELRCFSHQLLQIISIDTRYRPVMYLELDDTYLTSFLIKKGHLTTKMLNYNMINFRAEMLIRLICRVNQGYMHQKHVKFEAYDCLVKL